MHAIHRVPSSWGGDRSPGEVISAIPALFIEGAMNRLYGGLRGGTVLLGRHEDRQEQLFLSPHSGLLWLRTPGGSPYKSILPRAGPTQDTNIVASFCRKEARTVAYAAVEEGSGKTMNI